MTDGGTVDVRPQRVRAVIERLVHFVDPEDNPSGVVYGIITVGAVLAAESVHPASVWGDIGATVIVLLVYWMAHSYSALFGLRLNNREAWSWTLARSTMRREWAIVRGASGPIFVMLILALSGQRSLHVVLGGLIASLVLLVLFEVLAGFRARLGLGELLVQAAMSVLLGLLILLARALLI